MYVRSVLLPVICLLWLFPVPCLELRESEGIHGVGWLIDWMPANKGEGNATSWTDDQVPTLWIQMECFEQSLKRGVEETLIYFLDKVPTLWIQAECFEHSFKKGVKETLNYFRDKVPTLWIQIKCYDQSLKRGVQEILNYFLDKLPSRLKDSRYIIATQTLTIIICMLLIHQKEQHYRRRNDQQLGVIKKLDQELFSKEIEFMCFEDDKEKEFHVYLSAIKSLEDAKKENEIKKEPSPRQADQNPSSDSIIRTYLEERVVELQRQILKTKENGISSEENDYYREEIDQLKKNNQKAEREFTEKINDRDHTIHKQYLTVREQQRLIEAYEYETGVLRQQFTLMVQKISDKYDFVIVWGGIPVHNGIWMHRPMSSTRGRNDDRPNRTRNTHKHRLRMKFCEQTLETIPEVH